MGAGELEFLTIAQAARLLRQKKVSPVELVDAVLARAGRLNSHLNAFITLLGGAAREQARRAEKEILRGRWRGPLHGIPFSLKDNIWTRGIRTTAGSKILSAFVPTEDATVARRLARAGAILIGKTNMHEFAYGVTTENPHFGAVRNPWAANRIAGGSSGGSAAGVAAGLAFASLGTDTGGSIRIPAAHCGVAGLKPTFGRVSCYGVVPLARSLDHVGLLARGAADLEVVLGKIAGFDPRDPNTSHSPLSRSLRLSNRGRTRMRKTRLGWPRDYFFDRVDEDVRRAIRDAARCFESLGAEIEEISLPHLAEAEEFSTQIALVEATHFHRQAGYFPTRAAEYGADVRKRLEMGDEIRAVDYLRALEARREVAAGFDSAFERVAAILAPAVPVPATRIGEQATEIAGQTESIRSALIRLSRPANFLGLPAVSIPCGFSSEGLPIGLQLIGKAWDEGRLLGIAISFEGATEWHTKHPAER